MGVTKDTVKPGKQQRVQAHEQLLLLPCCVAVLLCLSWHAQQRFSWTSPALLVHELFRYAEAHQTVQVKQFWRRQHLQHGPLQSSSSVAAPFSDSAAVFSAHCLPAATSLLLLMLMLAAVIVIPRGWCHLP
jgi:hypothetical protein